MTQTSSTASPRCATLSPSCSSARRYSCPRSNLRAPTPTPSSPTRPHHLRAYFYCCILLYALCLCLPHLSVLFATITNQHFPSCLHIHCITATHTTICRLVCFALPPRPHHHRLLLMHPPPVICSIHTPPAYTYSYTYFLLSCVRYVYLLDTLPPTSCFPRHPPRPPYILYCSNNIRPLLARTMI
jgi:hypothetical protein